MYKLKIKWHVKKKKTTENSYFFSACDGQRVFVFRFKQKKNPPKKKPMRGFPIRGCVLLILTIIHTRCMYMFNKLTQNIDIAA